MLVSINRINTLLKIYCTAVAIAININYLAQGLSNFFFLTTIKGLMNEQYLIHYQWRYQLQNQVTVLQVFIYMQWLLLCGSVPPLILSSLMSYLKLFSAVSLIYVWTESWNDVGCKRSLKVIWSSPPIKTDPVWGGRTAPEPIKFLISPRMEIPQSLWASSSRT